MKKNNAVISIDFWNTLVKAHTNGEKRHTVRMEALARIAKHHNISLSKEEILEAHKSASRLFDDIWFKQQRTLTTRELIDLILMSLHINPSTGEMDELIITFQESLHAGPPDLADHISEVLPELAERYKIALISDTMYSPGRVLRDYLKTRNLYHYFDTFVFSDEVGYSKPNIKAFQTVLSSTKSTPEYSYHIGDIQDTDIKGAKTAGMKAILYVGISDTYKASNNADYVIDDWNEIRTLLLN